MGRLRRISLLFLAVGVGCSKVSPSQGEAGPGNADPVKAQARGKQIFLSRCFVCHGVNGNGQGPAATGLGANPRDYTRVRDCHGGAWIVDSGGDTDGVPDGESVAGLTGAVDEAGVFGELGLLFIASATPTPGATRGRM